MTVGALSLAFAPLLPWLVAGRSPRLARLRLLGLCAWRRARGSLWRAAGAARSLLGALANPSLVEEERNYLRDIAVVVVDDSPSQAVAAAPSADRGGAGRAGEAHRRIPRARPARRPRRQRSGERTGAGGGTRLFTALARGDVRSCRASASPASS